MGFIKQDKLAKEIRYAVFFLLVALLLSLILVFFNIPFLKSLRAILGLVYVLFLPGYFVVREFFSESIDWIEKLALSLGLSVPLVILSVMFSNLLFKIPITSLSNFLVILAVIIITLLVSRFRENIKGFFSKFKRKRY